MSQDQTPSEVVVQSKDNGILNREPAMVRAAVVSLVGAVATVLVVSGVLDETQKRQLEDNAGSIAVALLVIIPLIQGIWTRLAVFSPKTAAKIALVNARLPIGSAPTLDVPS